MQQLAEMTVQDEASIAGLPPEKAFHAFLERGRFMIQRSASSGTHVFFPRIAAPGTGETDLEWVQAIGLGTVYSVTIVRVKPPALPYNVVLVDLEEGPRIMSRVDGIAPETVRIGMQVRASIIREDDKPLIVFTPRE